MDDQKTRRVTYMKDDGAVVMSDPMERDAALKLWTEKRGDPTILFLRILVRKGVHPSGNGFLYAVERYR